MAAEKMRKWQQKKGENGVLSEISFDGLIQGLSCLMQEYVQQGVALQA